MKLSKPKKVIVIIIISIFVYFIGILFYRNHLLKKHELYSDTFVIDSDSADTYLSVLMRSARFRKANKDGKHSYIMQWTEDYANKKVGEAVNLLLVGVILHGIILLFVKDEDMK